MEILGMVFYFVLTIGILVLVHELGHFLAAKLFGMRVDTFSIGFPPRAFGKKFGETDYCISWIPIGGYVKIAGMIDESFDTEFLKHEPQPWEFRAKPIWQRAVVLSAGVLMNLVLAIAIFWGIIYNQGYTVRLNAPVGFVEPGSAAEQSGVRQADQIVAVDGKPVEEWDDVEEAVLTTGMGADVTLTVQRDGGTQTLVVKAGSVTDVAEQRFGIYPKGLYASIAAVESGKPAAAAGIQPGDTIVSLNGADINYRELPLRIKGMTGKPVTLGILRGAGQQDIQVTPNEEGRIGVSLDAVYVGRVQHVDYTLAGSFVPAIRTSYQMSRLFALNIYQIIAGRVSFSKSVGGPIKIAQYATRSAESGLTSFLGFLALLSISLALLNILPFPALDGGHLLFLGYEGIFRREIPARVKIAIQQTGFFILLAFMAFVIFNDIIHF